MNHLCPSVTRVDSIEVLESLLNIFSGSKKKDIYLVVDVDTIQVEIFDESSHRVCRSNGVGTSRSRCISGAKDRDDDFNSSSCILCFDSGALCSGEPSPFLGL